MNQVSVVKILEYLPLPTLDDMIQGCGTEEQREPACRPRKDQEGRGEEMEKKLYVVEHMNSQNNSGDLQGKNKLESLRTALRILFLEATGGELCCKSILYRTDGV